ncbi:methylated-DNA--[protein]-cysteine S-methyltransferase [Microbacterium sp. ZXX196]|uniref:methylated-DNA--[protein]-cysteine S-methyltransferase n=1 Tax=Microbacterium sp. ZXX196 TaxID=2609291 RepID=UPI00132C95A2|nr:methylated-DNA--[protein]-cysteine S-methyltransferase [Microbacterium sp. ZXX196]
MTYRYTATPTPIGAAVAVFSAGDRLVALGTAEDPGWVVDAVAREVRGSLAPADADVAGLSAQLEEYFAGERTAFDVEIDWSLSTGFAAEALRLVAEIPYGETSSYGEIAARAGRPRAARAVGTACRFTPITLVVPAHRVIRSDGSVGEYAGREDVKRFLLELEGAIAR